MPEQKKQPGIGRPRLPASLDQGWANVIASVIAVIGGLLVLFVQNGTTNNSLIETSPDPATSVAAPMQVPMLTSTDPSRLLPASGIVFATNIATNGQAVDAGTTFPASITDLYVVFRPDMTPPGMAINVDNPLPDKYYAYLKVKEGAALSSFGWRWYLDGELVNEFEMPVQPGSEVWLQRYDYGGAGIFGGELGPGTYRVVILLGGNPAMSADLTIVP